jgi:broad specificity phosphatase PhoE
MRLKLTLVAGVFAWCLLGIAAAAAAADQVIFMVRHAERADTGGGKPPAGMMANDPPLSAAGSERAKKLAAVLASADVKHIFTTELLRTRQTAMPLAEAARVQPVVVSGRDPGALAQQVRTAGGNVLIVGHTNTLPEILKQLGVSTPISIADDEFDNLFVIVRPQAGNPTVVRLRY